MKVQSHAPATAELLGEVEATSPDAVTEIVGASRSAQGEWAARGAVQRCLAVTRLAAALADDDELPSLIAKEVGKPVAEARAEVHRATHICAYYAGVGHELGGILRSSVDPTVAAMARRVPLGVVAVITPWNFPLAIPLWKLAPGLVSGCSVVWKPAPPANLVAQRLGLLAEEAGVPGDVLKVVHGDGDLGAALTAADVDAVTFTGSAGVGELLQRERGVRTRPRLALELGGVNVAHILADADVPAAARDIATAAFGYAGQKCTATQVVAADAAVHDQLVEALCEQVSGLVVGDPMREDVTVGPVITPSTAARLRDALAELQPVLARGDAPAPGAFVAPTLVALDGPDHELARKEMFGPVLGVARVDSIAERQRLVRASGMGLAASIFTRDMNRVRSLANLVGAGVVAVNRPSTGLDPHLPFGGWGRSGGAFPEQGTVAFDFFSKWQTLYWKSDDPGSAFP